jgi:hypothetical protein
MMDGYRPIDADSGSPACRNTEMLVAYLYSEVDADARVRFESHLKACPACARELDALSEVRQELAAWLPPEPDLGFTIVRKPAAVLRPTRWWTRPWPRWSQAAAAVLVLASAAAIANVRVRYDAEGVSVSTGWMGVPAARESSAPPDAMTRPVTAAAVATSEWRTALSTLESEMRREVQSLRLANAHAPTPASDAALLKRVHSLIDESEQRQRQELALRLTQFGRDVELQRRTDLVRIEQGFGQFEGRTGAEVARQRQLLDYLVRTSGRQVVP